MTSAYQMPSIALPGGYTARLYGRGPAFLVRIMKGRKLIVMLRDVPCKGYHDPKVADLIMAAWERHDEQHERNDESEDLGRDPSL